MKNIMETLEQTIDRKLDWAKRANDYTQARTYFQQAFGAVEFAMAMVNHWEDEAVIVTKWSNEWRPAFEEIMMEV